MKPDDRENREKLHSEEYVHRFNNERQFARVARLIKHLTLPPNADILDVGCGTGILSQLLSARYGSYVGVDFSQPMLQEAIKRAKFNKLNRCSFLRDDAIDVMKRNSNTYDAIFMLDISEHVPDNEWRLMIAAARHSLKNGGTVYLHTPNLDFFIERLKQFGIIKQFPEHIAVRNSEDNSNFFIEAGYTSVKHKTLAHYNMLQWIHPLSRLPLIGKYLGARLWITAIK